MSKISEEQNGGGSGSLNKRPVKKSGNRPANTSGRPSGTRKPSGNGTKRPAGTTSGNAKRTASNGQRRAPEGSPASKRRPQNENRISRKELEKKKRRKIILLIAEIVLLIIMAVVLYGVLKVEKTGKVDIPEKAIVINDTVQEAQLTTMKGYRNIALFGVDSTEGQLTKNTRTDTIMIASINQDTGECKLVSVYRDTYLNLSNDSYNKCNAAYAKGGPEQAINMLNMNLDMNITDFVTVGFSGLTDVIDALGGIEINVTEEEIVHLNNYQVSIVGKSSDGVTFTADPGSYTPVTKAGTQVLNGLQATAYCRIRYVGNDFGRTERQRRVIQAIMDKAKNANAGSLAKIAENVFDEVYTSLDLSEIVDVLSSITKYTITDTAGFPQQEQLATGSIGSKGSCIVPKDLESNVIWLHEFLFDDANYTPSSTVQECSEKIKSDTSSYIN